MSSDVVRWMFLSKNTHHRVSREAGFWLSKPTRVGTRDTWRTSSYKPRILVIFSRSYLDFHRATFLVDSVFFFRSSEVIRRWVSRWGRERWRNCFSATATPPRLFKADVDSLLNFPIRVKRWSVEADSVSLVEPLGSYAIREEKSKNGVVLKPPN